LGTGAVGLYAWLHVRTPGGLTGGTITGIWYGIAGSALMVYAGLLSVLRRLPSWWWIGSRKTWLRGHIWLGTLSGVLIVCHSGFRWGGPLEKALWVVLGATLATGVFGLLLQQFLPRLLTTRIQSEAPFEQIPHLCTGMRRRADRLIDEIQAKLTEETKSKLREFYTVQVRPFLAETYERSSPLAMPLQATGLFGRVRTLPGLEGVSDKLEDLEKCCDERRQLGEQERLHYLLHGWLLVHVPLSLILLVLGAAHAVMSMYY
jgi:hypothetical protein